MLLHQSVPQDTVHLQKLNPHWAGCVLIYVNYAAECFLILLHLLCVPNHTKFHRCSSAVHMLDLAGICCGLLVHAYSTSEVT